MKFSRKLGRGLQILAVTLGTLAYNGASQDAAGNKGPAVIPPVAAPYVMLGSMILQVFMQEKAFSVKPDGSKIEDESGAGK